MSHIKFKVKSVVQLTAIYKAVQQIRKRILSIDEPDIFIDSSSTYAKQHDRISNPSETECTLVFSIIAIILLFI